MNTMKSSRLCKLIIAAALMCSVFFTGSGSALVYADSPVTSTAIYKAYLDVEIVAEAEKSGLNRTVADYLALPGNPLDVKAAVINALYSDLTWSDRDYAEEYAQLVYGKSTASLDKSTLSAQELFVIGYLKVLDHYLDPDITWITAAHKALPDSQTAALIQALAASQQNMDCGWIITDQVLNNTKLTKDLRPEAVAIITEYMSLYEGSPCQYQEEWTAINALTDAILKDGVVLTVGDYLVLARNQLTWVDENNNKVKPYIRDGRTMVPLKFISANFGANIAVDLKKLEATVIYMNQKTVISDAEILNGRTFVPLRAVADALKKHVYYDKGLIIITDKIIINPQDNQSIEAVEHIRRVLKLLQK
ncbi:stalk domain-containing protein [Paenibacillus sp. FSL R7-0345]|uniref:stalk domain-containing protein n=1 Tax=Paenibacillus sp. FSL R7-0345 TaxID=2954535 RepID=UPI00315A0E9A